MIEDTQNRAEVIAQNASAENIPGWAAKLYDITPQLASKTDNDQKENEL